MTFILVFILGLAVGSFINVLIFRLDRKRGIWLGRSQCSSCSKQLAWYDLVPVISFVILKGRCRYCGKHISPIYPTVELLTGLLFLSFVFFRGIDGFFGIYELILITGLITIIFFDWLYFIIPDKVVFSLISLVLIFGLVQPEIGNRLATALIVGILFVIMHLGSHGRWMGLGDAKLVFLMGLIFGYPLAVMAIFVSAWFAASYGIALILLKKARLKTALPFGSFLASVSILFIIFQNELQKIAHIYF